MGNFEYHRNKTPAGFNLFPSALAEGKNRTKALFGVVFKFNDIGVKTMTKNITEESNYYGN